MDNESRRLRHVFERDREARRAEGAIDRDQPVVADHRLPLLGREAGDHRADIFGVAAAAARQSEPAEASAPRPPRGTGARSGRRAAAPGSVSSSGFTDPARIATCGQSGWSSRVWSRSRPSSPSGRCWNSSPPATQCRRAFPRRAGRGSGSAPTGRNSFAPPRQAFALQRDDALVALVGHRLVEGDREIALAEQREQRRVRTASASRSGSWRT